MPFKNKPEYMAAQELAKDIADLLTPQTGAYFDVWFDGEKAYSLEDSPELKKLKDWSRDNDHKTREGKNRYPIYDWVENPKVTAARLADPTGL
jgi:sulfite reductase (ferredoxin)